MALIVEDGSGKSDAESYASVAEADAYHTKFGAPTTWSGASTATKEAALRIATQYLDTAYGTRFQGDRVHDAQALFWPRYDVERDGKTIFSTTVPAEIKSAAAEMALRYVAGDTLIPDISEPGSIGQESVEVGPVSQSITYLGGKSQVKQYRKVDLLLAPLLLSGSQMERA